MQQVDEVGAGPERVGDGAARIDLDGGPELVPDFGYQRVPGERRGAVQGRKTSEGAGVRDVRAAASPPQTPVAR
jgi:hypothetical protein